MKAFLCFIVLIAAGLTAMYYTGGFKGFDATQQGKDARAAITPGMPFTKVFSIAREPRKYRDIIRQVSSFGGVESAFFKPGPQNPFKLDVLTARIRDNNLPWGFVVTYHYSNMEAFTVEFDGTGRVVSVTDAVTMADLLQTR